MVKIAHEWVEDLMWYDGPLLTHIRSGDQDYIDVWCNVVRYTPAQQPDATWMWQYDIRCLVKVSKDDLAAYLGGQITLRTVQQKSEFLLLYSWHLHDARDIRVITPAEFEQLGYMASEGSYSTMEQAKAAEQANEQTKKEE